MAKRKAFKAKPKASQPKGANIKSHESLWWIGWVQLTLTWEIIWATSESYTLKNLFTSRHPSANKGTCDGALYLLLFGNHPDDFTSKPTNGIQPVVSPNFQETRSQKKNVTEVSHLIAPSSNMISRGRDVFHSRKQTQGTFTPLASSSDSDYSPGLSQVVVE